MGKSKDVILRTEMKRVVRRTGRKPAEAVGPTAEEYEAEQELTREHEEGRAERELWDFPGDKEMRKRGLASQIEWASEGEKVAWAAEEAARRKREAGGGADRAVVR
jgi:hypothetical protein